MELNVVNRQSLHIQNNSMLDLFQQFKIGLGDNNKNVIRNYIQLIPKVIVRLDPNLIKGHYRQFLSGLFNNLQDKNQNVRNEVITTVEQIGNHLGYDSIISQGVQYLNHENPEYRIEFLKFINRKVVQIGIKGIDVKGLLEPLIKCLLDKNKEVRSLTETFLIQIFKEHPNMDINFVVKDMKPAFQQEINSFYQNKIKGHIESAAQNQTDGPKSQKMTADKKRNTLQSNQIKNSLNQTQQKNEEKKLRPSRSQILEKSELEQSQTIKNQKQQITKKNIFIDASISRPLRMQRYEQEQINPWPLTSLNDMLCQQLFLDLQQLIDISLLQKMLSLDYQKNIEATQVIISYLEQEKEVESILNISDLLIKWAFVRVWSNQTMKLIQIVLQMVNCLLARFTDNLQDFETNIVLGTIQISVMNNQSDPIIQLAIDTQDKLLQLEKQDNVIYFWIQILRIHQNEHLKQIVNTLFMNIPIEYFQQYLELLNMFQSDVQIKPFMIRLYDYYGEYLKQNGFMDETLNQLRPFSQNNALNGQNMSIHQLLENVNQMDLDNIDDQQLSIIFEVYKQINNLCEGDIEKEEKEAVVEIIYKSMFKVFQSRMIQNNQLFESFMREIEKIFRKKELIGELDNIQYGKLIEDILHQLLQEDINKKKSGDQNHLVMQIMTMKVKLINSIILQLLENSKTTFMFSVLFDLLIKFRNIEGQNRFINLLVNCMLKLTTQLQRNIDKVDLEIMFLKFHEYCQQSYQQNQEDNGIKAIKTILREIVSIKKSETWKYYEIVKQHSQKDVVIHKWIHNLVIEEWQKEVDKVKETIVNNINRNANIDKDVQDLYNLLNQNNKYKRTYVQQLLGNLSRAQQQNIIKKMETMSQNPLEKNRQENANMVSNYNNDDFQKKMDSIKNSYAELIYLQTPKSSKQIKMQKLEGDLDQSIQSIESQNTPRKSKVQMSRKLKDMKNNYKNMIKK